MGVFSTDKDFWGNTHYYDENGNEIGTAEDTWLGNNAVYKDGEKVADIQRDWFGNEEIVFKSDSLLEKDLILTNKNAYEGWEFCEEEYDEFDEE